MLPYNPSGKEVLPIMVENLFIPDLSPPAYGGRLAEGSLKLCEPGQHLNLG